MPKEGAGKEGSNQKKRRSTTGVPNPLTVDSDQASSSSSLYRFRSREKGC
jgi:hypothetical protein